MSGKSSNPTVKERLTCVETLLGEVYKNQKNHLEHHFWTNVTLLGCVVTEAAALVVLAIKLL